MLLSNSTVLITGHSGFKGSWLCAILGGKGANISGLSLEGDEARAIIPLIRSSGVLQKEFLSDIRDPKNCHQAVAETKPEVVFHLAAQPLVRRSYRDPLETWTTNVIGTANILEACRHSSSVKAIVVVTTDKCYENKEWFYPYRENDRLGGHDPYSASKACAELVTSSYRNSYFRETGIRVATARAGNVFGGGDLSEDRLIPDAVRAFSQNQPLVLRNPHATRPWQHVLEPLAGYVALAERLLSNPDGGFDTAWNFGPNADGNATVGEVATAFAGFWGNAKVECLDNFAGPHEAGLLQLDNSRAKSLLDWSPRWSLNQALRHTAEWYRTWHESGDSGALMKRQIEEYFGEKPEMLKS
jgi:CDP-glucose 4,6-dehydratase